MWDLPGEKLLWSRFSFHRTSISLASHRSTSSPRTSITAREKCDRPDQPVRYHNLSTRLWQTLGWTQREEVTQLNPFNLSVGFGEINLKIPELKNSVKVFTNTVFVFSKCVLCDSAMSFTLMFMCCRHICIPIADTASFLLQTQLHSCCRHSCIPIADTASFLLQTQLHSYCRHSCIPVADTAAFLLQTQLHSYCRHSFIPIADTASFLLQTQLHSWKVNYHSTSSGVSCTWL
jgi:hypothetical protein